jgi:HSP20 family protein
MNTTERQNRTLQNDGKVGQTLLHPAWQTQTENDTLVLKVVLPGVKPEDIELQVEDDRLELRAKGMLDTTGEGEQDLLREFAWGDWSASFRLPRHVDPAAIRARCEHGILTLELAPTKKPVTKIALAQ